MKEKNIIVKNAIRCLKCKCVIQSMSTHDIQTCKCGSCSVDGGLDYLRRVGNPDEYEDLSKTKKLDNDLFLEQYRVCFDENNQIKPCGRAETLKLLEIIGSPEYGNFITGKLNINKVKQLYCYITEMPVEKALEILTDD